MALTVKPLEKVRKNVPVREVVKTSQEALVRVNIEVEKEMRQRWRTEALQRGISLRELIQEAVERYVK